MVVFYTIASLHYIQKLLLQLESNEALITYSTFPKAIDFPYSALLHPQVSFLFRYNSHDLYPLANALRT